MDRGISQLASVVNQILGLARGDGREMRTGEVERRLLSLGMKVDRATLEEFAPKKGTG